MSTDCENHPPVGQAQEPIKKLADKSTGKPKPSDSGRKKLQTLQPSSKNKTLLVGADGLLRMSGSAKKEPMKIYEDPAPAATSTPERKDSASKRKDSASKASQASVALKEDGSQAKVDMVEGSTQVEDADTAAARAESFMYEEEFPPEYWKELAEKRREALEQSLIENEELHTSLTQVEEEKQILEAERDELKSMAEQAEELAKIVKSLVNVDDEDEGDVSEEGDESKDADLSEN